MIKVLLVDDEKLALEYLEHIILLIGSIMDLN